MCSLCYGLKVIKGSRSFIEQESLPFSLSTG